MKELQTIVSEFAKIDFSVRKAAIATVVRVKGSSYRSPGARMLITDDGKWVGSISGGCLEGDALRKARTVMHSDQPMTATYDTREESNQNLGIGLGCNGVIDVLIEPVTSTSIRDGTVDLFNQMLRSGNSFVLATIITGKTAGDKFLLSDSNDVIRSFTDEQLSASVLSDATQLFESKRSEIKSYQLGDETTEVFLELIQPSVSLIIFGGGFDARPVHTLAKSLGWNVTVTDECVAHIAPLFFPSADKLSLCNRSFVDRDFNITANTACVLMSHNYEYDRDVLRKLLNTATPYIGILGPRKRFDKMVVEFAEEGVTLDADATSRIHSPIGLDIGAETPDEIALSIVGEIQAKFSQRSGGFLKYRVGPIHMREHSSDQVIKQVYMYKDEAKQARIS
jgi:xanthine dehydrogenase accessory factor